MKEDKLDKILGSKLKSFEESPPSADMFSRIEKSLAEKGIDGGSIRQAGEMKPKRGGGESVYATRKSSYERAGKYAAVAAVIACAMVVGGIYLLSDKHVESVINPNVAQNSEEKQEGTNLTNATNGNTFAGRNELIAEEANISTNRSNEGVDTPHRVVTLVNEEGNKTVDTDSNEIFSMISVPPDENVGTGLEEAADITILSVSDGEAIEQTRQLWADLLTGNDKKSKSKKQTSGATLYAGNIGQGNSNTTDMREIAASNMVVKERSSVSAGEAQKSLALNYADYEGSLTHKMPVTLGVGFSYSLNDRVTLSSGVTYTFMRSDANLSQNNNYSIEQRLHYVGIPLGASYSVVKKGRWDIYFRGGVMFEKVVSSKLRCTTYTDSGSSTVSSSLNVKGVQFSVSGATGIMYRLTDFMGLYVEPGVSYYFENNKQPANYRTAHPTNFTIQAGVRFSINGR